MKIVTSRRNVLGAGAGLLAMPFGAVAAPARIITLIGTGIAGMASDGEPAATAQINNPYGLVVGPDQRLYWADIGSHRVLSLDLKTKRVFVVAGNGEKGYGGDGGPAKQAQMNGPHEVRCDRGGNIYVVESGSNTVRRIDAKTGIIKTVAGTGVAGFSGDGGPGAQAQLDDPHGIALDKNGNLFVCDVGNNRLRRRDAQTGIMTTFAGTGEPSAPHDTAPIAGTPLRAPRALDMLPDGTMFLVLEKDSEVVAIDPVKQTITRVAGTGQGGDTGDGGPARDARISSPKGIAVSASGNVYICDTENNVVRVVSLAQGTISVAVGSGKRADGSSGDPLECSLARPHGVTVHQRSLYIGDSENHRIRVLQI